MHRACITLSHEWSRKEPLIGTRLPDRATWRLTRPSDRPIRQILGCFLWSHVHQPSIHTISHFLAYRMKSSPLLWFRYSLPTSAIYCVEAIGGLCRSPTLIRLRRLPHDVRSKLSANRVFTRSADRQSYACLAGMILASLPIAALISRDTGHISSKLIGKKPEATVY